MMHEWRRYAADVYGCLRTPVLNVNLRHADTVDNDPFYSRIVREFHDAAQRRHPKCPLVRALQFGVAVCELPPDFDSYFMSIEAAGRRNVRKARRCGYRLTRIDFNAWRDGIRAVRRSTDVRQGPVADNLLSDEVELCADPPSRTRLHDYAYYGVLRDEGLAAYGACLVAGELTMLEHVLGHAAFLADGVVPMLIAGIAGELMRNHPSVRYYAYGTYFGAGETMRRFKRKFRFLPRRVNWVLG